MPVYLGFFVPANFDTTTECLSLILSLRSCLCSCWGPHQWRLAVYRCWNL